MICPHCELDTPATEANCIHCDGSLAVLFDEVEGAVQRRDEARQLRRSEAVARTWLLFGIVFVVLAGVARVVFVDEAAEVYLVDPAYTISPDWPDPVLDLPLELPPVEIPTGG